VESQLQGKRLRWLGHVFRMPNDSLSKELLFGELKGLRPPGRLRSSFMVLHYMILKTVVLVGSKGRTRQAALERQYLSCTYLAHHELESVELSLLLLLWQGSEV